MSCIARWLRAHDQPQPPVPSTNRVAGTMRKTTMKPLIAVALVLMSLFGIAATACSDDVGQDYYENEIHNGYPGPGTKTPENRGGG
jgi:hypothetical protein